MEKDDLSSDLDLLNELGLELFEERLPWIGGDLQTLRDTFISDSFHSVNAKEISIEVPSLPTGKAGKGKLLAYLEEPLNISSVNGLVLILHGLGGSTKRKGLRRMAQVLIDSGFVVLKLNLRGSDPCRDLIPGTYAAECNNDLFPVLLRAREIADSFASRYIGEKNNVPLYGAGISLGGTILLNACLSSQFSDLSSKPPLDGLVCISSPLNLSESSDSIERPRNFFYQKWLLRRLIRQTLADPFGLEELEYERLVGRSKKEKFFVNDIRSFDSAITAPRWGYENVEDYYFNASPLFPLLEEKKTIPSTLIIQSNDDPWVPSKSAQILKNRELSSRSRKMYKVLLTEKGGHNGFHGKAGCWGDEVVKSWLLRL